MYYEVYINHVEAKFVTRIAQRIGGQKYKLYNVSSLYVKWYNVIRK